MLSFRIIALDAYTKALSRARRARVMGRLTVAEWEAKRDRLARAYAARDALLSAA